MRKHEKDHRTFVKLPSIGNSTLVVDWLPKEGSSRNLQGSNFNFSITKEKKKKKHSLTYTYIYIGIGSSNKHLLV